MDRFDLSVSGFWWSFSAALIVLPVAVLTFLAERKLWGQERADLELPSPALFLGTELVGFALTWAAFVAVMALLCRQIGLSHRFVPLIVAYNWSNVIAACLLLPPVALYLMGALSGDAAKFANFAAFLLIILYHQRVAEIALGLPPWPALTIPLIDVALNILIDLLTGLVHVAPSSLGS